MDLIVKKKTNNRFFQFCCFSTFMHDKIILIPQPQRPIFY
jgi:hypothetical protein